MKHRERGGLIKQMAQPHGVTMNRCPSLVDFGCTCCCPVGWHPNQPLCKRLSRIMYVWGWVEPLELNTHKMGCMPLLSYNFNPTGSYVASHYISAKNGSVENLDRGILGF